MSKVKEKKEVLTKSKKLFAPNFKREHADIEEKNTQEIVLMLSKLLADEFVLSTKMKNAHWNVEGIDFYEKHIFFEVLFRQIDGLIDTVAERIRLLEHYAPATMKSFLELTHLSEELRAKNDSYGFISELLIDNESIVMKIRENMIVISNNFHDSSTYNFIEHIKETHEKMAWILRSHLKK